MNNLKISLSIVSLVFLICIFTAPQAVAQDDGPVPWPCYKPTVDRSENPRPCNSIPQDDDPLARSYTAFLQDEVATLQLYREPSQGNGPVMQHFNVFANSIRNRDALLKNRRVFEFAFFRSKQVQKQCDAGYTSGFSQHVIAFE